MKPTEISLSMGMGKIGETSTFRSHSHRARKDKIAEIAYLKWADAGKPSGRDVEFWLAAEKEINE